MRERNARGAGLMMKAMALVVALAGTACGNATPDRAATADMSDPSATSRVETVHVAGPPPGAHQAFPAVDPVDGSLWFSTFENSFNDQTLWRAPAEGDGWGTAAVVSFSGRWGDRAARFSPDGARLYFTSNRPLPGEDDADDMNIWVVERTGAGWGDPSPVPAPVSTDEPDIHAALSSSAIWVPSGRTGGMGRSDLYRVPIDASGAFGPAEHLPAPLNSELSQPDLWIAADESWLILAVTDHPDGYGGDDLWRSRRVDGGWSPLENLGPAVNLADYEYGPSVTPDGRWLLFTSHREGPAATRRVPLASVAPPQP